MKRNISALAATVLLLSGCVSMAPDYQRPGMPVATAWPTGPAYGNETGQDTADKPAASIGWQDFALDPRLRAVLALGLEHNRDLRVAALNIERARAQYQIRSADTLPSVGASGSTTTQRVPADLAPSGEAGISRQYSARIAVSAYELDLFGRVRSLRDEALQRYLATEEARRSVQLGLVVEIANAYLSLGADNERLVLARHTLENRKAAYQLMKRRHELGTASMLDLRQAQTVMEGAKVDVARFTSDVAQGMNMLTLLVGALVPPDLLPSEQGDGRLTLAGLDAGLPSEVLRQRPDVLEAEHLLQAANANIGAARAAFFPSITLTASAGTASSALSSLFDAGTGFWSFVPQIHLPIFDNGRNRANLRVSEADRDIAVATYEKSIQNAFREVADALARQGTIDDQVDAQSALVEAAGDYQALSQTRFERGLDHYLNVLDAQRSLYAAQQGLIDLRQARNSNHILLYKALGGGWQGP